MAQTKERHREWMRERRARANAQRDLAAGLLLLPGAPGVDELIDQRAKALEAKLPKRKLASAVVELDGLGAFERWPTQAACALAMAELLDSPAMRTQHVPAAKALAEFIATIRAMANAGQAGDETRGVLDVDPEPAPLRPALRAV